jgi:26S proteasome regulatory subunit N1
MVASENEQPDALKYALLGTRTKLVQWGHEYLRNLAGQIGKQYEENIEKSESTADLLQLVD